MEIAMQTFWAILETFLVFGIGAYLAHRRFLTDEGTAQMSRLALEVLMPLLTISAITRSYTREQLCEAWLLPTLGFGMMAVGALLGFAFRRGMRSRTPARSATFHHFCATNNYLFLPLIVLDNLWGEQYVGMLMVMNVGTNLGYWTVGVACFGGSSWKEVVKNVFSVNLYAVLIAFAIVGFRIPVPEIAAKTCACLGSAMLPLALLTIGVILYRTGRGLLDHLYDLVYLTVVRLVLLPLLLIVLLKFLPLPEPVFRVLAVVAVMPVSCSSVLVARRYGGDLELASQAVVFTTLASLITVPLMLWIIA